MKYPFENTVSITINAAKDKVWKALTDPAIIKQYFFGTNTESDWKPGSPITFRGEYEGKKYHDKGSVLENEKGKKLKYNYWSSMSGIEDLPENYANITYTLDEIDINKTGLTIHQDNIPDEERKKHSAENWKLVMNGLKNIVEKKDS